MGLEERMHDFISVWAIRLVVDAGRYLIAASAAFLVFWVWGRERWRHRRIGDPSPVWTHMRRETIYSGSTVIIFSLVGTGLVYGTRLGVFRVYYDVRCYGWTYFALSIAMLAVLHDTYFYWTHRAMHLPRLFRPVHLIHHLSTHPTPWAAYAFAPAEAVVQALFVPLVALFFPFHEGALFVFLVFMIVRNVLGHLGLELFPPGFVTKRAWRLCTTTTHHAMHHRQMGTNYGLYFTFWDRLMGTMAADYEAVFEKVAGNSPPSRSITLAIPGRVDDDSPACNATERDPS
jgi:lathosterol oxidase